MPVTLKTKGLDELHDRLEKLRRAKVQVGFTGSQARAQHRDRQGRFTGITNAALAAIHEFGLAPGVPARPVVGPVMRASGKGAMAKAKNAIGQLVQGRGHADDVFEDAAEDLVERMRDRIESGISPDLAASTLADPDRDQRGIPLLDTEQLRDAIGWERVEE